MVWFDLSGTENTSIYNYFELNSCKFDIFIEKYHVVIVSGSAYYKFLVIKFAVIAFSSGHPTRTCIEIRKPYTAGDSTVMKHSLGATISSTINKDWRDGLNVFVNEIGEFVIT